VRDAFAELETSIAQALTRAQREGEVKRDLDVDGCARALVALTQGLHVLARVETDSHRLHDAVDAALAALGAIPSRSRS
jgi:TetR/AcrR family transcriptional repressor of nem operon